MMYLPSLPCDIVINNSTVYSLYWCTRSITIISESYSNWNLVKLYWKYKVTIFLNCTKFCVRWRNWPEGSSSKTLLWLHLIVSLSFSTFGSPLLDIGHWGHCQLWIIGYSDLLKKISNHFGHCWIDFTISQVKYR